MQRIVCVFVGNQLNGGATWQRPGTLIIRESKYFKETKSRTMNPVLILQREKKTHGNLQSENLKETRL